MTIKSRMSWIMDLIRPELSEFFCLWICKNCWIWLCLHPSIHKCRWIGTKHGHNMYDNEILDEFDYGSNLTVTSGVICRWRKNCLIWLCLLFSTLASTNNNQSAPTLVRMYVTKILKEFNYESNRDRMVRVICPLFKKTVIFDFVYSLSSANIDQSAPNLGKIFMSNRIWMIQSWVHLDRSNWS